MKYRAHYTDDLGNKRMREFYAAHMTQAQRKAQGIGRSNGWKLVSCGRI